MYAPLLRRGGEYCSGSTDPVVHIVKYIDKNKIVDYRTTIDVIVFARSRTHKRISVV